MLVNEFKKIKIFYKDGTIKDVMIIKHKLEEKYSYINLTKMHICQCKFNTIDEAIKDLSNYKKIERYEVEND